eukprot:scaffold18417_cov79-Skeletonema_dohrnii-CCMP3373.AAC.7
MFVNIPLITDWHLITTNREQFVNEQLWRSNTRRQRYCTPGLRVLKNLPNLPSLATLVRPFPYNITQVQANRTITILLTPGVTERINIRRASPYQP